MDLSTFEIIGDTTFYAVWDKTAYCKVTFDGGEGKFVLDDSEDDPKKMSTYSFAVAKGSSISDALYNDAVLPSNPTVTTKKWFKGWYVGC